jgi:hypothetical protein
LSGDDEVNGIGTVKGGCCTGAHSRDFIE